MPVPNSNSSEPIIAEPIEPIIAEPLSQPEADRAKIEKETVVTPSTGKISSGHADGLAGGWLKKIGLILLVILALGGIGFSVFRFVLPRFLSNQSPLSVGKETTLTYWGLWEPEAVMQQIIAEWEAKHPTVKINYVLQSPQEYRERLQSALARGEGPDVFRFHISWVPMFRQELATLPSTVMKATEFEANFYPVAVQQLRGESGFLGIPLMMDNLALFYNRDLFAAMGKTPPTSWDELRQTAQELTVRDQGGRIVVAGVPLGVTGNVDHWSDILGLMMLQNSVDFSNLTACVSQAAGEACLAENALTFFTLFSQVDRVWDETLPNSTLAFATGKAAMYFGPSWRIFNIKEVNPQLNFGVAPVPQLTADRPVNWATFWVEGVSQKSQLKKQAWEFLAFLTSQEVMEKFYQSASQTRLFGEIYSRQAMASILRQNELLKPFVDQAPSSQTWYLCSQTFDNGLNDRMIKYFEDAVNAVNQGRSAKEALQTTASGVSQLLNQYGLNASF